MTGEIGSPHRITSFQKEKSGMPIRTPEIQKSVSGHDKQRLHPDTRKNVCQKYRRRISSSHTYAQKIGITEAPLIVDVDSIPQKHEKVKVFSEKGLQKYAEYAILKEKA